MYRADASDNDQKIERLERDLNVAYQEQYPASDNSEVGLALLRFRAQRLARDIESFRARHTREPVWRVLGRLARRQLARHRLATGFVVGVCTFAVALCVSVKLTGPHAPEAAVTSSETAVTNAVESQVEPAPSTEPTPAAEPAATAAPDTAEPALDPPAEAHVALSVKDYKELLARSHAFFRAVEKRDGHALAELVHPLKDLQMGDERVSFTRAILRDCFSSRRTYTVQQSAAGDDTEDETCGAIFHRYAETPYERAPDVLFNEEPPPDGLGFTQAGGSAPFVYFYFPDTDERNWHGLQLAFERYDHDLVLTGVHRVYWTP
jgi:hypothetical protein